MQCTGGAVEAGDITCNSLPKKLELVGVGMLGKSSRRPKWGHSSLHFLLNHLRLAHLMIQLLVKEMGEVQDHMADIRRLLLDLGSV